MDCPKVPVWDVNIILNKKSYNVDLFTSVKTIVISGDYPQNESR
jgi:hypothetical protein